MRIPDINFIKRHYVEMAKKNQGKPKHKILGYVPFEYHDTRYENNLSKYKFSRIQLEPKNKKRRQSVQRNKMCSIEIKHVGTSVIFDSSGYINSQYHGEYKTYYPNGKLESESYYVNDESIYYIVYDKFGNIIQLSMYSTDTKYRYTYEFYLHNIMTFTVLKVYDTILTNIYQFGKLCRSSTSIKDDLHLTKFYKKQKIEKLLYNNSKSGISLLLNTELNISLVYKNNQVEDISYLIDLSEGLTDELMMFLNIGYLNA